MCATTHIVYTVWYQGQVTWGGQNILGKTKPERARRAFDPEPITFPSRTKTHCRTAFWLRNFHKVYLQRKGSCVSLQANRTKNYTFFTQSILEFLSQEWLEERQPEPELWRPHPSLCFPHTDPTKRKSARSRWSHPSNRPDTLFTIFSLTCFSVKIIKWAVYSSIIIILQSNSAVSPQHLWMVFQDSKQWDHWPHISFCLPSFAISNPTASFLRLNLQAHRVLTRLPEPP